VDALLTRILLAVSLLGAPAVLSAQATPTAIRKASLQVGGGYSNANTDYTATRASGWNLFFDYDFFHHLGLEGEFRYIKDSETNVYEKTYEVGPRYSRTYHERFSPYVKGMYGRGVFNFTNQKQTVANIAYNLFAFGGGLDYTALRHLNLRGEYEYQTWLGFHPNGLTPTVITIGAAYRFR
jgi:opacity protein-like surface antigen